MGKYRGKHPKLVSNVYQMDKNHWSMETRDGTLYLMDKRQQFEGRFPVMSQSEFLGTHINYWTVTERHRVPQRAIYGVQPCAS